MANKKENRIGEIKYNNYGQKMTIISYLDSHNVTVKFDNGYIIKCQYGKFKRGSVKSPYDKSVYEVGYIGEGKYKAKDNLGKQTIQYSYWSHMMTRCYNKKYLKTRPTYEECEVCEEWHNFQNFAKWFDDNSYENDGGLMKLDKDILHKGNKVYSPENCVFVPNRINTLFVKRQNHRGEYPIGVSYYKKGKLKFVSQCYTFDRKQNKSIHRNLGYFETPKEAFNAYKTFKENYIKQVADDYKDKIPKKLYEVMYNWEVEITD